MRKPSSNNIFYSKQTFCKETVSDKILKHQQVQVFHQMPVLSVIVRIFTPFTYINRHILYQPPIFFTKH